VTAERCVASTATSSVVAPTAGGTIDRPLDASPNRRPRSLGPAPLARKVDDRNVSAETASMPVVPQVGPRGGRLTLAERVAVRAPYLSVRIFELLLRLRRDPLLGLIDEFVKEDDVAVDVGAHRGWYSDRMAARVGSRGTVHAFEPNPDSLDALTAVARHAPAIALHPVALSDKAATGSLMRPYVDSARVDAMGSISNPAVASAAHDSVEVQVTTLDDSLGRQARAVRFMKIDVEGHEHEVLLGAERCINASHPVIVVEIEQRHRIRPVGDTFAWLAGKGYAAYAVGRGGRRPIAEFDIERDQVRYVTDTFRRGRPHPDYISDFLFLPPS
jgi:FkbM family methyltransferase